MIIIVSNFSILDFKMTLCCHSAQKILKRYNLDTMSAYYYCYYYYYYY